MIENSTFIHSGQIHIDSAPAKISTVLGSCVAVCLYDTQLGIGGMNHYLLPFWNGNGLQTPKYGNISIPKMIEVMEGRGSMRHTMVAKVFGGALMPTGGNMGMMIGHKNILVAKEILEHYNIPIIAEDTGGFAGRKILFDVETGKVMMKYAG